MANGPSSEQSPWAQRSFVLAAAFIAVVVVAGLGLLIAGGGDSNGGNGNDASQARGGATRPANDPSASVCGLPAGKQQIPAAPPEAQWELVGTIAAPTAPTMGPGIERGDRRLCFAHSPTGALFAAVNFVAVAGRSPNDTELLRVLTAAGELRDQVLEEAAQEGGSSDSATRIQVAGFRVVSYSRAESTVDLAFRVDQQGHARVPVSLRWERRDWKAVIASRQGPFAALEGLDDLSGYVPWSGA